MNEPSAFIYEDSGVKVGAPQPPPQPGTPLQEPFKFSPDELRVLGECNQESFFQRSMPIGTAMGLGAYFAIQQGHLKPNPRFGVIPKVTLAVVMGYFIGKVSYQEKCAEKLMALPGSYIGQLLRERKDGKIRGYHRQSESEETAAHIILQCFGMGYRAKYLGVPKSLPEGFGKPKRTSMHQQAPSMFGAGPNDIYSDAGPGNSLDLDTDRPIFSDDLYRPDNSGSGSGNPPEGSTRPILSYDDLRRRNRGEYSDAKQNPYRMDPNLAPPITRPPQPSQEPSTNKYGDTME